MQAIEIKAFQKGDLSLGELAASLGKTKAETMLLLSNLCIPVADYSLKEDEEALEQLGL